MPKRKKKIRKFKKAKKVKKINLSQNKNSNEIIHDKNLISAEETLYTRG